jgi:hypothetical protein
LDMTYILPNAINGIAISAIIIYIHILLQKI